jgi:hypothetical protein
VLSPSHARPRSTRLLVISPYVHYQQLNSTSCLTSAPILCYHKDTAFTMDSPTPRRRARAPSSETPAAIPKNKHRGQKAKSRSGLDVVDILRGIVGLIVLSAALSWFITGESIIWNWRQFPTVLGAAKRWLVCIGQLCLRLYNF